MPVVPQFYTLRRSRRYLRQRQRRRLVAVVLGVGILALGLGYRIVFAPGPGERPMNVELDLVIIAAVRRHQPQKRDLSPLSCGPSTPAIHQSMHEKVVGLA